MSDAAAGARVLVTGARGFVGRHLVSALAARGAEVHCTSRTAQDDGPDGIRWWRSDLGDMAQMRRLFADTRPDFIFHLSSFADGRRDRDLVIPIFQSETVVALHMLTAASEADVRRMIMAGSLEEPLPGEAPSSPYAAAKAASRSYARMFHCLYGTPVAMTRIFMAYGPGQPEWKLIPSVAQGLLQGQTPAIASPDRAVDWIFISDVVDGLLAVMAAPGLEGESVDIGSGELVPIRDLVEYLRSIIDPARSISFGNPKPRLHEQVRKADPARTRRLTGWEPRVSLRQGLEQTVAALRHERSR